jgi:hypothetical protein
MRCCLSILIALAAVTATTDAWAQVTYQHDDGSAESTFGAGATTTLMLLNRFQEQPGGDTVSQLGGVWGSAVDGVPVTLFLYDDPDNDGDPSNAVLLASTDASGGSFGEAFFVPIQPTVISGIFFVAIRFSNAGGLGLDEGSAGAGRTWATFAQNNNPLDVNDLTNNDFPVAPASETFVGDPLAMLRAQSIGRVPALGPAGLGLLIAILVLRPLASRRR